VRFLTQELKRIVGLHVDSSMLIDRERFLVLVASLATGASVLPACNGSQPPPEEPRVAPDPALAPTPIVTATVAPVKVEPQPVPVASGAPPPPPGWGAVQTATIAAEADAGAEGPDPYKGTPIKAQSCSPALNNQGTPPACSLKAPGPTCESFSDTKQECPTLTKLLKPRVAQAAIECLRRKSGTKQICEFNETSICAYEALQSACLDPSAKAVCNKVVQRCGAPQGNYNKMTREACEAGVSGIADQKRSKFIACISESCRFETCLASL